MRYLRWLSINAQCFNVGTYRRADTPHPPADFFHVNNTEGERLRRCAAEAAMRDLIDWFENGEGTVAILDATNSTKERRRWIAKRCATHGFEVMFVESKCDDEEIIMANIREVKTNSPDYEGQDPDLAAQDFARRIKNYESVYETIVEPELTYVKLINVGAQVVINCIRDYLQSRIVYYLMNLHIKPRSIWLSRVSTSKLVFTGEANETQHGESEFNLVGKIGGDADISRRGRAYSEKLPELVKQSVGDIDLTVWTSTLKRTIQTAQYLPYRKLQWKALDELDAGVCDGLTYEEIEEAYPEDFRARDDDKYASYS